MKEKIERKNTSLRIANKTFGIGVILFVIFFPRWIVDKLNDNIGEENRLGTALIFLVVIIIISWKVKKSFKETAN